MKKNKKGYVVAIAAGSTFYVDDATHIERDDSCNPFVFQTDEEAAKAAEKDGIRLIHNMPGVMDGVYLDTPQNREILTRALENNEHFYQSLVK